MNEKIKIPDGFDVEGCPFCGSRNIVYTNESVKTTFKSLYGLSNFRLICENCGASGPICETLIVAVEIWNAQQASQQKTIDDLKSHLYEIENILGEALYGRDKDNMPRWKPEPAAITLAKEFAWRHNNNVKSE
jgi:transcription elongation factor Elf1